MQHVRTQAERYHSNPGASATSTKHPLQGHDDEPAEGRIRETCAMAFSLGRLPFRCFLWPGVFCCWVLGVCCFHLGVLLCYSVLCCRTYCAIIRLQQRDLKAHTRKEQTGAFVCAVKGT